MFTYTYKDELGNEVTITISHEVHEIIKDGPLFEQRIKQEYKRHITDLSDSQYNALPSLEDVEETVMMCESLQNIFDIVSQCTDKQRRRFLLHVVYGLKLEEIARIEGCTFQSVHQSIKTVTAKIVNSL